MFSSLHICGILLNLLSASRYRNVLALIFTDLQIKQLYVHLIMTFIYEYVYNIYICHCILLWCILLIIFIERTLILCVRFFNEIRLFLIKILCSEELSIMCILLRYITFVTSINFNAVITRLQMPIHINLNPLISLWTLRSAPIIVFLYSH